MSTGRITPESYTLVPDGSSPWGIRNRQLPTDPPCKEAGDFDVAGNGLGVAGLRVLPQGVQQPLAFHPTTTSSLTTSGGRERKDSSRRYSEMLAIASRRFAMHSSRDLPWPFAPGTSAQYPIYHGPSCSTIAVNSLCTTPFYSRQIRSSLSPSDLDGELTSSARRVELGLEQAGIRLSGWSWTRC